MCRALAWKTCQGKSGTAAELGGEGRRITAGQTGGAGFSGHSAGDSALHTPGVTRPYAPPRHTAQNANSFVPLLAGFLCTSPVTLVHFMPIWGRLLAGAPCSQRFPPPLRVLQHLWPQPLRRPARQRARLPGRTGRTGRASRRLALRPDAPPVSSPALYLCL